MRKYVKFKYSCYLAFAFLASITIVLMWQILKATGMNKINTEEKKKKKMMYNCKFLKRKPFLISTLQSFDNTTIKKFKIYWFSRACAVLGSPIRALIYHKMLCFPLVFQTRQYTVRETVLSPLRLEAADKLDLYIVLRWKISHNSPQKSSLPSLR